MRLLVLLFLASPLAAQTLRDVTVRDVTLGTAAGASNEQVLPNDNSAPAGDGYWRCSSGAEINFAACDLAVDIDEGYQGSYDAAHVCNDQGITPLTEEARVDFADPSSSPTATVDGQLIRVVLTKTAAACGVYDDTQADPTIDISVWDGDSLELIANDVDCGGWDQNEVTPYTWTYEGGSDGSEVYVELFDNGNGLTSTNRRRCSVEAIDWYAEVN